MSRKESSDELNPTTVVPEVVGATTKERTALDYVALGIATCGVGYLPIAPGTIGSLVAVLLFLILRAVVLSVWFGPGSAFVTSNPRGPFLAIELIAILIATVFGIWAASRTEKVLGLKDPGKVVIDEVAGQLIALLPLTLTILWPGGVWVMVSFILFRFFDIVKPYPARRFEALHGGLGIMADDLVAGFYAAVVTAVTMWGFGVRIV